MSSESNKSYHAFFSGFCAASGSVFGKISGLEIFSGYLFVFRIISIGLMLLFNGFVWTFFAKALQTTSSSLHATVTSAATNYLVSGILGIIIFQEDNSLFWWLGISLILIGLFLVTK